MILPGYKSAAEGSRAPFGAIAPRSRLLIILSRTRFIWSNTLKFRDSHSARWWLAFRFNRAVVSRAPKYLKMCRHIAGKLHLIIPARNFFYASWQVLIFATIYVDRNLSTRSGFNVSYVFPDGIDSLTLNLGPATEPALEVALNTLLTRNVTEDTMS